MIAETAIRLEPVKVFNYIIKKMNNKQSNINFDVRSDKLNFSPFWLTGLADVGSFAVNIVKSENNKLGWRVQSDFSIKLHIKDFELLQNIKAHFGVGSIRRRVTTKQHNTIQYNTI